MTIHIGRKIVVGFLDFVVSGLKLMDSVDTLLGKSHGDSFIFECNTVEIFEISEEWKGTSRVHGAGKHLSSEKVSHRVKFTLPEKESTNRANRTNRELLRENLRSWLGEHLAQNGRICEEALVLNESENCLTVEGFGKRIIGGWTLLDSSQDATNYIAFKVTVQKVLNESQNELLGHDKLFELIFEKEARARLSFEDVQVEKGG